ncbi:hypothetical protein SAMN05428989_1535 [Pseudoxanthomonas sp. GM95]|uniref:hypothetical protein n=1 Tax=Pseudoxanthomonas sp. GM95 TaxID=1881043 RepID=UPI0008D190DD|nr:hypothetical protein [Pseudoxanthomonas sp. GM95]SEL14150.1 hypothetical protein SAMN05428989_1535 [Pseudoxanthomonas sp. GM95]
MKALFGLWAIFSTVFAFSVRAGDLDQALDAGRVAAENFEKELFRQQEQITIDESNKALVEYVYDRRNYSIGVSRRNGIYVVVFSLKQDADERMLGGGAMYEIEVDTLRIASIKLYE